jgi:hypothetical protein
MEGVAEPVFLEAGGLLPFAEWAALPFGERSRIGTYRCNGVDCCSAAEWGYPNVQWRR